MKRDFAAAALDGPCTRVFVGSLAYATNWQSLKDHFKQAGDIEYASVLMTPQGMSKGCGMVDFKTHESAMAAVQLLNESLLDGRHITVKLDEEGRKMQKIKAAAPAADNRPLLNVPPNQVKRVFVGNLSYETNWQALKDHFSQVAVVELASVLLKPDRTSKGCGMVNFMSNEDAMRAVEQLNESELDGRTISVKLDVNGKFRAPPAPGSRTPVFQKKTPPGGHEPGPFKQIEQATQMQQQMFRGPAQPQHFQPHSIGARGGGSSMEALQALQRLATLPGAKMLNWPELVTQMANQVGCGFTR
eukprot:CAMPEP_0117492586 /NCGR_PEP_ID=MMETSP0784-20121206/18657_1 /TAXON_ID=39447 /ORGANISM="" /LENGTH=301 /DNA_ID=CAMNT_0005287409 /DNA_START=78 /DNA_END=983 /DNA_ORIENTATION=+